jgi:hypothetical protein
LVPALSANVAVPPSIGAPWELDEFCVLQALITAIAAIVATSGNARVLLNTGKLLQIGAKAARP